MSKYTSKADIQTQIVPPKKVFDDDTMYPPVTFEEKIMKQQQQAELMRKKLLLKMQINDPSKLQIEQPAIYVKRVSRESNFKHPYKSHSNLPNKSAQLFYRKSIQPDEDVTNLVSSIQLLKRMHYINRSQKIKDEIVTMKN